MRRVSRYRRSAGAVTSSALNWYLQYVDWLVGLFRGDLGTSYAAGFDIWDEIQRRFGLTFSLAFISLTLSCLLALVFGTYSGLWRRRAGQRVRSPQLRAATDPSASGGQLAPRFANWGTPVRRPLVGRSTRPESIDNRFEVPVPRRGSIWM